MQKIKMTTIDVFFFSLLTTNHMILCLVVVLEINQTHCVTNYET